jgi:sialic acid synthase SpsE
MEIVNTIMKTGNKNFMIFHAITSYPTPYELANLNVIKVMLDRYSNIIIGYSDYTIGWQCSYADVSGLIEKFGYKPDTDLKDGIGEFVKWYREFYGESNNE